MKNILILILVLFLTSCEGIKVTNDWDREVDFTSFKTYSMYPWDTHNSKLVNDYDKQTIIMAIKKEMDSRGYLFIEKDGDLIVSSFVVLNNKTSYQSYTNHYGGWAGYGGGWGYYGRPGYYGYGWGPGYSTTTTYATEYTKGTLIIDIFSLLNKKLVWQGIGSGEVTDNLNQRDKRLPTNITKIFRRFPVHPKKQK